MKRKIFLSLFSVIALSLFVFLTGCSGGSITNKNNQYDLKITFFNGGYGEEWLKQAAARFEEARNVKIELIKSADGPCGAESYMKSGYNISDIYIAEGAMWKSWVQNGYLEDLTDVYEAEVETKNGKVKIKDYIDQEVVGMYYAQRKLSNPELKPWALPWTVKPNAMAYNMDILPLVKHTGDATSDGCVSSDGYWVNPPKTYKDLELFCEDMKSFDNKANGDNHDYVALGWAGGRNADSVSFMLIPWWAELQGLNTPNYSGEGTFFDFFNFGNTVASNVGQTFDFNVYNQTGLKEAYNMLANILVDKSTKQYTNSVDNPFNVNLQQLQQLFVANRVSVKPVLTIASSYLENEVIRNQYFDSDNDGIQDVNFKYFNAPKISETGEDLLYTNYTDSMFIPQKAAHKELAKEFLIFMCSEAELQQFTINTRGGIRPFNYDAREIDYGFSVFANSVFDVYYNSTHVFEYPKNVSSMLEVSHVYRYEGMSFIGNSDYLAILNLLKDPGTKTPGQAIQDTVMYNLREAELSNWINKYRLTDITK